MALIGALHGRAVMAKLCGMGKEGDERRGAGSMGVAGYEVE
jgi:hypothetical protein